MGRERFVSSQSPESISTLPEPTIPADSKRPHLALHTWPSLSLSVFTFNSDSY